MSKHGKAYLDAKQRFDRTREYEPVEAIALVKQLSPAKFNESIEVCSFGSPSMITRYSFDWV